MHRNRRDPPGRRARPGTCEFWIENFAGSAVNVREVVRIENDAAMLVLSDGTQVGMSRSRRPIVERVVSARLHRAT